MNRVIKFRGKLKEHFGDKDGNVVIQKGTWIYGGIVFDEDRVWIDTKYHGQLLSDKDTIGQYTGLHDKNGKEIYESDIVEIDKDVAKTFDIYSKGIINYLNGGFIVTKNDGSYATIKSALLILGDLNNIFRGKVIGNIYENPDLLKGADNIE